MKNKSRKIKERILEETPVDKVGCAHTFHNIGTRDKPKYKCSLCGKFQ